MAQTGETLSLFAVIGDAVKRQLFSLQDYSLLAMTSVTNIFTPPYYWADVLEQMDFIGIGSLPIVLIIGFFIGPYCCCKLQRNSSASAEQLSQATPCRSPW